MPFNELPEDQTNFCPICEAREKKLEKVRGWAEIELEIYEKVSEKSKEIVAVGSKNVIPMVKDTSIRLGKIEILAELLSILDNEEK